MKCLLLLVLFCSSVFAETVLSKNEGSPQGEIEQKSFLRKVDISTNTLGPLEHVSKLQTGDNVLWNGNVIEVAQPPKNITESCCVGVFISTGACGLYLCCGGGCCC